MGVDTTFTRLQLNFNGSEEDWDTKADMVAKDERFSQWEFEEMFVGYNQPYGHNGYAKTVFTNLILMMHLYDLDLEGDVTFETCWGDCEYGIVYVKNKKVTIVTFGHMTDKDKLPTSKKDVMQLIRDVTVLTLKSIMKDKDELPILTEKERKKLVKFEDLK